MADTMRFIGAVLPLNPPIDKVAALAVVELWQEAEVENLQFWGDTFCPPARLKEWAESGILAIDLGEGKYHRNAVGSATEFIVQKLGIEQTSTLKKLLGVLARNNASGYLKAHPYAIAWILREFYELPEYDYQEIIRRGAHVVKVWLWADDGVSVEGREDEGLWQEPGLKDLLEIVGKNHKHDFTVAQYILYMWRAGYAVEQIRELAQYWITGCETVKRLMAEAEEAILETHAQHPDEFPVYSGWEKFWARWLETLNPFLAKAAIRNYDIVVLRQPLPRRPGKGLVSVMTAGLDVSDLYAELERREPGKWHMSSGCVINGGRIYQWKTPTDGTKEGFRWLLQMFPPRRPRRTPRKEREPRRESNDGS